MAYQQDIRTSTLALIGGLGVLVTLAIVLLIVTNAIHRLQLDAGIDAPEAGQSTVAIIALWVALILALISGIDYFRRFARAMPGLWSGSKGDSP